jgi:hypothetical protein
MLIEIRGMLSLVLHLADTTPCTICVIVQDRLDLATQGLAKKVVLVLVSGFVVSLLNFNLRDIVFIVTTKALPSWSLIFLLVIN